MRAVDTFSTLPITINDKNKCKIFKKRNKKLTCLLHATNSCRTSQNKTSLPINGRAIWNHTTSLQSCLFHFNPLNVIHIYFDKFACAFFSCRLITFYFLYFVFFVSLLLFQSFDSLKTFIWFETMHAFNDNDEIQIGARKTVHTCRKMTKCIERQGHPVLEHLFCGLKYQIIASSVSVVSTRILLSTIQNEIWQSDVIDERLA